MKKSLLFLLTIVMVVCFASCSLSMQKDEDESTTTKKLIKVSFCQEKTKSLTSEFSSGLDTKFYLSADPQFTRGTRDIVGDVEDQAITPDANGDFEAGYFEQGKWDFTVDAYLENEGATIKTLIASKTIEDCYISEKNNTVSFTLEESEPEEGASGTLTFSIKVPKISTSTATLKVLIDGTETAFDETPTQADATDDEGTDLIKFSGTISSVAAGLHNITLKYYVDNSGTDVLISSELTSIRVVDGATTEISGTMMNEKYAKGSFNVVIVSDSWSLSLSPTDATTTQNTEKTFTVTATGTSSGDTVTYQWYVDGSAIEGANATTYKFKSDACGIFSITCLVKVNGFAKTSSTYVYVSEATK